MAINETELKNSMMSEAARTQKKSKETAGALGTKMPDTVGKKAYRSGRKMLAQKELARYDKETKKLIDDLVRKSGMVDQAEQQRFRTGLEDKFRHAKKFLFKQDLKFGMEKAKLKLGQTAQLERDKAYMGSMAAAGKMVGMGMGAAYGGSGGTTGGAEGSSWGAASRGDAASQNINASYEGDAFQQGGTDYQDVIQHGADAPSGFDPSGLA